MLQLEFSLAELCIFLVHAKRNTYAGDGSKTTRYSTRTYRFSEGPWSYDDRYVGNLLDTGLETVRFRNFPVWAMSYRGGMLLDKQDESVETFAFLKRALKEVPVEAPVRGPQTYTRGEWTYANMLKGTILDFSGQEDISRNGIKFYTRSYQGGIIYDKKYSVVLQPNL